MNSCVSAIVFHVSGGDVEITKKSLLTNGCGDIHVLPSNESGFLNSVCDELKGDYVLLLSSVFQLAFDDALKDVQLLAKNNQIVCFGTNYELDGNNKYDPHWRHPLANPSLSSILTNPSAYIAILVSRKVLNDLDLFGNSTTNIYEALISLLLRYCTKESSCSFIAYNLLTASLHAEDINKLINCRQLVSFLCKDNPILAPELDLLFKKRISVPQEEVDVLDKLYHTVFFKMIMDIRKLLKKCGYYKIKAQYRNKQYLRKVRKEDAARICNIEKKIMDLPQNMLHPSGDASDIVVSLTTHGSRFAESAPYAIYSIFAQSVLPHRIVVSVDEDSWDDNSLPPLIKRLKLSGLEVLYCRDVRSHTKLLPALAKYKDNPIITVDDDMFYEPDMIKELVDAYDCSDKKTVLCRQGVVPKKQNGRYIPYMKWIDASFYNDTGIDNNVSPLGVSGVIYPPHIFDEEVFKDEVFLRLAPHTDDIWFWVMEVRSNIKAQLIGKAPINKDTSISMIEYLIEAESTALYFQNCFNGRNDIELNRLLDYYHLC